MRQTDVLSAPPTPRPARLAFRLPPELEAHEPPEARGVPRDGVRLMVARRGDDHVTHSTFSLLPRFLDPGDLVVVNTSGTLPAALGGQDWPGGRPVVVHLSTRRDDGRWIVEPRRPVAGTTERWSGPPPDPTITLAAGAALRLEEPVGPAGRLWVATLVTPGAEREWITAHGRPIRYSYVGQPWPVSTYQSVYVTEEGSAEMPSAGRPISTEVVTRLVAQGVAVAPLLLHTGVASLEADELPLPERAVVPPATARLVNVTRAAGGRVVAVGTTVVRALESAVGPDGEVRPFDGWADVVVTPERGVAVVDGIVTGWHEPEASHLLMLEAIGGRPLLERSYAAAIAEGYLWHEFGDAHLILRR
ncbi:S-adenosylmethionine:tRNA ribosyltransferase-isomerase [Iamia sp. SCSIO 61187]|uniref:S-adenosylmethionine:tRNA ribosyltransferase-isomerase n=1 Tax=Iamia sp. SCSIO 61187 TaxID=2722752 RepID=UPI001C639D54|nr:S-adenosylmethionine:tRNA ribosyltransferase-isomerase [Iamia sp. SCSIO 61187]QYG91242.1 S-adenosylmethionine:tRNA ribosyltransferase-isomerase [Iamia sp. SCSIO 61187]